MLNWIQTNPGWGAAQFNFNPLISRLSWNAGALALRDLEERDSSGGSCPLANSIGTDASSSKSKSLLTSKHLHSAPSSSSKVKHTVPASAPSTTPTSVSSRSGSADATITKGHKPSCISAGGAWMSPTAYCDCGTDWDHLTWAFPTVPNVPMTNNDYYAAICAITSLDPAKSIHPQTTSKEPNQVPGADCHSIEFGPDAARPYALDGWCEFGNMLVPGTNQVPGGNINCALHH